MSRLIATTLRVALHRQVDSPVFGDSVTHITIDDEGAGPYVVLSQSGLDGANGPVRLDFDELDAVSVIARRLLAAYPQ